MSLAQVTAMSSRDAELMERLVDEQIRPFRRLGVSLIVLGLVAWVVAYLEFRDASYSHPNALYIPSTSWVAYLVGVAMLIAGIAFYVRHRKAMHHRLFDRLVRRREDVVAMEVRRVLNSRFDRIIVCSANPVRETVVLVRHRDLAAVHDLLKRVYPNAARSSRP